MKVEREARLLRVFMGEHARWQHQPLYEAIVLKARDLGLAGATVLRGPMGFGAHTDLHTAKILRLSLDLPIIIEIVDAQEKIDQLIAALDEMKFTGMLTLGDVKMIRYTADPAP